MSGKTESILTPADDRELGGVFVRIKATAPGFETDVTKKWDALVAERDRYCAAVLAVRRLIEPSNPCHDGFREALLDALNEADHDAS